MVQYSNLNRVLEQRKFGKSANLEKQISRKHVLRKAHFTLFKVLIIFLSFAFWSTTVMSQTQELPNNFGQKFQTLSDKLYENLEKKDYQTSEKFAFEAIDLFNQLSTENQENYKWIQCSNFYNLTCVYSGQKRQKKQLMLLEKHLTNTDGTIILMLNKTRIWITSVQTNVL